MGYKKMNKSISFAYSALVSSLEHNRSLKNTERMDKAIDWSRVEMLEFRAKGRKIHERDDEYQLREEQTVYRDWPDSEYENTFAWKLVN